MAAGKTDWADITGFFRSASADLAVGELCARPTFSLRDAMMATELMDPKMDAGLASAARSRVNSLEEAIALGLPVDNLPEGDLLAVLDDLVAALAHWLTGRATLAQSVFTCLYTHEPALVADLALKAFVLCLLKVIRHTHDVAMRSGTAEEEDLSNHLFGFALADNITTVRAVGMAAEALELLPAMHLYSAPGRAAIAARVEFMQTFAALLESLDHPKNVHQSQKLALGCRAAADACAASLALAHPLVTAPAAVKPFEPLVASARLPPGPPRASSAPSRAEAYALLAAEVQQLHHVAGISACTSLRAVQEFIGNFSRRRHALALSRAVLFHLFLPSELVLGHFDFAALVENAIRQFDCPHVLIPGTALNSDPQAREIMLVFFKSVATVVTEFFRILCNNAARQRRKLAKFLPTLQQIVTEAHDVNTAMHALWLKYNEQPCKSMSLSSFILRYNLEACLRYLWLGFELDLYAPAEVHFVLWYTDYLLAWMTHVMTDARAKIVRHLNEPGANIADAKTAGNKKNKKSKRLLVSSEPSQESIYFEGLWHMATGLVRMFDALKLTGHVPSAPPAGQADLRTLYAQRFAPFAALDTPALVPFENYLAKTDVSPLLAQNRAVAPMALLQTAMRELTTAMSFFDNLLQPPAAADPPAEDAAPAKAPAPHLPADTRHELEALVGVAKRNIVVCGLAARGTMDKKKLSLDMSHHHFLPVIKFA